MTWVNSALPLPPPTLLNLNSDENHIRDESSPRPLVDTMSTGGERAPSAREIRLRERIARAQAQQASIREVVTVKDTRASLGAQIGQPPVVNAPSPVEADKTQRDVNPSIQPHCPIQVLLPE